MRLLRRPRPSWLRLALTLLTAVSVTAGLLAGAAHSSREWADEHLTRDRLLPGTRIAGIDVGGQTEVDAVAQLKRELDAEQDAAVTVAHQDREWTLRPDDVGAEPKLRAAVTTALERGADAGWVRWARARWWDGHSGVDVNVPWDLPSSRLREFVDRVAGEIDREPRAATLAWSRRGVELVEHRDGRRLDRDALAADLARTMGAGGGRVRAEVEPVAAAVTSEEVASLRPAVEEAVDAALSREVTVTHRDREWRLTPREVGARPRMEATVAAHRDVADDAGGGSRATSTANVERRADLVELAVPDDALSAEVDAWAEAVERAPRDATLDWSTGRVEIAEEQAGVALDREQAVERLATALDGASDTVRLPTQPVEPEVTVDDYRHVVLLRQSERRLYHYVDGEIARQWPVAVGTGDSPTPTGRFTVGTKRHRPAWVNPAPDGWGADMPEMIEPGPDNPLGVRALNWHRNGADTLIRFHGTPDVDSIGTAASQGCVRLTNAAVVDLYDRIPRGTPIISLAGEAPRRSRAG